MSTLVCKNVKLQDPTGTLVSTLSYDGNNITLNTPLSVPTAVAGTNNNQVATTGFVINEKGGRKNYLINGNFDKWDYGTSQTTSGYGSDNRWRNYTIGSSTITHSQVTCGDIEKALFNATYFSRTVVNSVAGSGNCAFKFQPIENVALLSGKTVTLSFWAKADTNKNIAVEFWQRYGSGGNPTPTTYGIGSQQVSLTTTWQKKTITITLPSIIGRTLGMDGPQTSSTVVAFWFDAGSSFNVNSANLGQQSGTFDIAQVKLEDGSVATNGWHPYDGEFGSETQACARYYEIINIYSMEGNGTGGNYSTSTIKLMPKRTTPSVSEINLTSTNVSALAFPNITSSTIDYRITVNSSGQFQRSSTIIASAEL
jgi:hypothetical protein